MGSARLERHLDGRVGRRLRVGRDLTLLGPRAVAERVHGARLDQLFSFYDYQNKE